jgi:WD40 repeat protein
LDNLNFVSVKVHPDGHFVALGSVDGNIILWNINENQLIATLKSE